MPTQPIKVLGHINPDTDTTCSAIAYAWYLNSIGKTAEPVVAGSLNKETQFVLEHFKMPTPRLISELTEEDQVVIVDTNNPEELLAGYDKAEILEIIDHHKLIGGLHTPGPISFTLRPVACTATVLLSQMKSNPPAEIAGLMLAAILSDTLNFTSPTVTEEDKAAAERLKELSQTDFDTLATAMFAAKSDLSGMSATDILTVDSKIFPFGERKARVSVLETTLPANALAMREELEETMRTMKTEDQLDAAFFFVVDIIKGESTLIVPSDFERELASKAFGVPFAAETIVLPGVISRKKQIVPKLEEAFGA